MSSWPAGIRAITLFVEDLAAARQFCREVFSPPIDFEDADSIGFNFGNTPVNLLTTSAAPELSAPLPVARREAGSRILFTIGVGDGMRGVPKLTAHGVELLNGPVDRPWGVRTASFRDPAGHIWAIAK